MTSNFSDYSLYLCLMAIHVGKKVKEELDRQRMSVIEFAKKINRSRNVAYNIFERESIDTDLLNKIGKVLNCDFFSLYSIQKEYNYVNTKNFFVNEPTAIYNKLQNEQVIKLQNQIDALQNEINYLKKINSLLENKKASGKKPLKKKLSKKK